MDRVQADLVERTGLLFELRLPLMLSSIASGACRIELLGPIQFYSDSKRSMNSQNRWCEFS